MKLVNRIFMGVLLIGLLCVSWLVVLGEESSEEKQNKLVIEANKYLEDEVYIYAIENLEEAANYNTVETTFIEERLKELYLQFIKDSKFSKKYRNLLDKQMNKNNPDYQVFLEAAEYYFGTSKYNEALDILKDGILKTNNEEIVKVYEENRYIFSSGRSFYEDVTTTYKGTIGVKKDGFWGVASANGDMIIPTMYEKVTTYSSGFAVVEKDGQIFSVDNNNFRLALLKDDVKDIGNFDEGIGTFLTDAGWQLSRSKLTLESNTYEDIGTFSNGYLAAKENGKWGVIDKKINWILEPQYDEIIMDELGRAFAQNALFAKNGEEVFLLSNEFEVIAGPFDNARPFSDTGYAAVKKDDKWGFIDNFGNKVIDYKFDNALSFGQHLAAVQIDDLWGYINLYGDVVIEADFLEAKSFYDGHAPVRIYEGWKFISLREYKDRSGF